MASSSSKSQVTSLTFDEIKDLLEVVSKSGLEEVELESGEFRLHIIGKRAATLVAAAPQEMIQVPAQTSGAPQAAGDKPVGSAGPEIEDDSHLKKITSPMVGTFYRSPAPESPSFVNIGDNVSPDSVLCIIEAMKLMNEIKAEAAGKIVKIYVENGQPVEYGQPIFGIEPN